MSIKIDGNRPMTDTDATDAADAARRAANEKRVQTGGVDRPAGSSRDRVEVSEDAQLLTTALSAAEKAPAIRTELVERLKEKLNAGEIGQDSGRLADRLIDDILDR